MNDATTSSYAAALKQAEAELAAHDERGQALRNTVESLRALLAFGAPEPAPAARPARKVKVPQKAKKPRKTKKARTATTARKMPRLKKPRGSAGAGHPSVPANHYQGMGPTAAYRKFIAEFGQSYSVPQIRDALVVGGVQSKSSTSLLTGLHSVRRRDEAKAKAAPPEDATDKAGSE